MKNSPFIINGNLCADRVRLGRALQKPPLTQSELAIRIQLMGVERMTPLIISRIEKNQRHVCDAELWIISRALDVPIEWLIDASNQINHNIK
ncbi:MAG: helix-turn-helix domain-containing protein [Clostridia bacterium]